MDSGVKPIDPAELLGRGSSRSLALDEPNAITLRHKTRGRDFSLPLPGPDRHKILHTSEGQICYGRLTAEDRYAVYLALKDLGFLAPEPEP